MAIGDGEPLNIDKNSRKPPKTRIKNAKSARELYQKMVVGDQASAKKRSAVQAMLDGKPPYSQAVLNATGQGGITNLDWGEGEAIHDAGVTAMLDIVNSVEDLVTIPLKFNAVPDEEMRIYFEQTLAREASRTIREWDGFDFNYQELVSGWYDHGIGIAYHEDCWDWRFEVSRMGGFLIPRGTRASESKLPYAGCMRPYQLHELWEKIEDEKIAENSGWNVAAVKTAMVKCAESGGTRGWDDLEQGLRNNDYGTSAGAEDVKVVHLWVKQFNGSVSLLLFPEQSPADGDEEEEPFLYEKHGMYEAMQDAFTFFCFGIGTNGTYHGIVGQAHKIYPMIQYSNRLLCKFVDAAAMGGSVLLQPINESDMGNLALVTYANYTVLPSENTMKVVEHGAPDLSENMIPALHMMQQMLDRRAGQLDLNSPAANSVEKTAMEIRTMVGQNARIGQTNLSLFIPPWGRLCRNMVKRLCRPDYDESLPGGKESKKMRQRLQEAGFPLELLAQIDFDAVTCTQAIGAGSPAARQAAMMEIEPIVGRFDAVGQHNFYRAKVAAAFRSYRAADPFIPRMAGDTRPPQDVQIANLENTVMALGQDAVVVVNQIHTSHLDTHLPKLMNDVEAVESGQVDMAQAAGPMAINHDHCVQHLQHIDGDPTIQEKTALYRQALQQAGEIIENGQRKLEAQARKAQEAGEAQQQQSGGMTPEQFMKLEENNVKLTLMRQETEVKMAAAYQKMAIERNKANQDMSLKDVAMALKVMAMRNKQSQKAA